MKVVHNNQTMFVSWRYDDPNNPNQTECILATEDKNAVVTVKVKRYYSDPCNKEKARYFSLKKLIDGMFPNPVGTLQVISPDGKVKQLFTPAEKVMKDEAKLQRSHFWEAYRNRNKK